MLTIYRSEASASLRRVPIWFVTSNGTSPATGESGGQPQIYHQARNTIANTSATLSVVSANAGEYYCELTASEVSQLGVAQLQYRSATALQNATYFQIVNVDSGNSTGYGLTAWSEVSIHAGTHSSVTIQGLSNYANISNVTLAAGTHSGATIQGLSRINSSVTIANATYSGVTVRLDAVDYSSAVTVGVGNIKGGTYSDVTIQGVSNVSSSVDVISDITGGVWYAGSRSGVTIQGISNYANISNVTLAAGTHSGATIQGLSRINSSVTIANALYSAVTVRLDTVAYSGASVGVLDIKPGSYSGVSVEIKTGGIQAASFGASAIDAAALATDAGQEIADRLLARNIAGGSDGGRTVSQAQFALRNRVLMSGSTGTVYSVDDSTSAWTFSVATQAAQAINEIDPGGT